MVQNVYLSCFLAVFGVRGDELTNIIATSNPPPLPLPFKILYFGKKIKFSPPFPLKMVAVVRLFFKLIQNSCVCLMNHQGGQEGLMYRTLLIRQHGLTNQILKLMKQVARESGNRKKKVMLRYLFIFINNLFFCDW